MTNSDHDGTPGDSSPDTRPDESHAAEDTIAQTDASQFVPGVEVTDASHPLTFGRYRILQSLGQGAMGVVYLARDSQLRRQVALKFPMLSGPGRKAQLERFYREARSAAVLSHRNVCTVYDVGEFEGFHFIAMAYVEGDTLSDRINEGQYSQKSAAELVQKLAQALLEAHRQQVIHRDLKPSNIMLDSHDEPIIMDFGLARQIGAEDARLTASGAIMGSPSYMSPEQTEGDRELIGPTTDIYSLGVIFYELLSGHRPFTGSVASVLAQVLTAEPPSLSELRSDVDPQLESICLRMMAKKVEDRFPSMADVVAALSRCLDQTSVSISEDDRHTGSSQTYRTGETIDGQYLVERRIKGGMSTVYIVQDNITEKRYALKSLEDIDDRSDADRLSARFEREAAVWVNFDHHKNIVQAHALLKREGRPMLLLEYMQGPSLSQVLAQHGPLSVRQSIKSAREFCAGMHYVHSIQLPGGQTGILHRDIKPDNITFDHKGTLKVTDFGLARLADGRLKSRTGEFFGTVAYSSPEQLNDTKHIDRRSEIFSFGVVFYEMLTGQHPFSCGSMAQAIHAIHFQEPQLESIPTFLRSVVQRCLEKTPEPRFESFADLDDELERIQSGLSPDANELACPSCGFIGVSSPVCVICNAPTSELPDRARRMTDRHANPIVRRCQCGVVTHTSATTCQICGSSELQIQCRRCSKWNPSGDAYCNHCGSSQQLSQCQNCSKWITSDNAYCDQCGSALTG